jgi:hypothetical protein
MNKNRIPDGLDLFVTQNVHLKTKWAWFDLSKPLNYVHVTEKLPKKTAGRQSL